ncbi:MAG: CocE/NonD family hydrolase [Cyanobacteria bacterium J06560_6]
MLSLQARQTYSMRTRDGARLDADVYMPEGPGPFPVLLMRQPYGRAIASTIVYAHPRWYAAQGYIVVIQDVRGRGSSEGKFDLFAHEVTDGEDTVCWASQLPKSDGQVGMYGFSYQGMTQLFAAQNGPSALKTIVPAMTGYHLYEDWATENGALCFQLGLVWALQLAAETARIKGDSDAFQKLSQAARHLPLADEVPVCPEVLSGVDSFFHDWVACSATDDYWQQLTPQLADVDLPMLHIGGWFDPYLRGDVRLYREMAAQSRQLHHFWIGPWAHIPWSRKVGALDFGPAAISPVDRLQVRWFDAVLKRRAYPALAAESPIRLFEMGRNQWRALTHWPERANENTVILLYELRSEGLSSIREDSGVLMRQAEQAQSDETVRADTLVHDPWNPAPSLGGHSAIPAGPFERTAVDARGDVLTYTTEPLEAEMRIAGVVEVVCAIAAAAISYDLCAVLSRVHQGNVYNLTQGYRRINSAPPGETTTVQLPLHPTCFSLAPAECLRLSLSAACFPAHPINPGTGKPLSQSKRIDAQIITLTIQIGPNSGTLLKLPILE